MRIFTFLILLLLSNIVLGQTEPKHPIDVQRQNCHDIVANQTTVGMVNCENIAADLWDKEVNKYYNNLMKWLNKEDQEILKASQRKWMEYRDNELSFSEAFYTNLEGSMWRIVAAGRRCDIIRTRALELKEYLGVLQTD